MITQRVYPLPVSAALRHAAIGKHFRSPYWVPADALARAGGQPAPGQRPTLASFAVETLLYNAAHLPACAALGPPEQANHVVWASGAWQPVRAAGEVDRGLSKAAKLHGFTSGRWARAKHLPPSVVTTSPPVAVSLRTSRAFFHISQLADASAVVGKALPRLNYWGSTGALLGKARFAPLRDAVAATDGDQHAPHQLAPAGVGSSGASPYYHHGYTRLGWFLPHELGPLGLEPRPGERVRVRADLSREFVCYPLTAEAFKPPERSLIAIAGPPAPTAATSAELRDQLAAFGDTESVAVLTADMQWVVGAHASLRVSLPPGRYVEVAAVEQLCLPRFRSGVAGASGSSEPPPPMAHVAFVQRVTPWNIDQLRPVAGGGGGVPAPIR
jgi:hypothetical protein